MFLDSHDELTENVGIIIAMCVDWILFNFCLGCTMVRYKSSNDFVKLFICMNYKIVWINQKSLSE